MNFSLIFILLIICLLFGARGNVQKISYLVFSILFSLIFSMRSTTSPDTSEYIHIFQSVMTYENWFDGFERFEAGYCCLNRMVKSFVDSYEVLFFIVSLFNFLVFYIVLKRAIKIDNEKQGLKKGVISIVPILAFYTSYYGLLYNSIALRAGIALSLLYLSFVFLYEKKLLFGILPLILAPFFHQTAILALPLALLFYYRISIKRKSAFVIFFISLILYITNIRFYTASLIPRVTDFLYNRFPDFSLFWWISHYTDNNKAEESGVSVYMLLLFLLAYILLCNCKKKLDTFVFVYIIGIVIYSLFGNYSLMIRYAEYFQFSLCISFGVLYTKYSAIRLSPNANNLSIDRLILNVVTSGIFFIIVLRNSFKVI